MKTQSPWLSLFSVGCVQNKPLKEGSLYLNPKNSKTPPSLWPTITWWACFRCLQYHFSPQLPHYCSRYTESPASHPSHTLFSSHLQTKRCLKCFCDGRSLTTSVQQVILVHLELESYLLQLIGGFSLSESRSSMSNNQNIAAVILTQ